jgi:hypothetical protein
VSFDGGRPKWLGNGIEDDLRDRREKVKLLANRAGEFLFLKEVVPKKQYQDYHTSSQDRASVSCVLSIRILVFPAVSPDFVFVPEPNLGSLSVRIKGFQGCVNSSHQLPTYLGRYTVHTDRRAAYHDDFTYDWQSTEILMERIRHLNALPSLFSPAQVFF